MRTLGFWKELRNDIKHMNIFLYSTQRQSSGGQGKGAFRVLLPEPAQEPVPRTGFLAYKGIYVRPEPI